MCPFLEFSVFYFPLPPPPPIIMESVHCFHPTARRGKGGLPPSSYINVCNWALFSIDLLTRYIQAVHESERAILQRQRNPLYYYDWFYFFTPSGQLARKNLKILHDFTRQVIVDRKMELEDKCLEETAELHDCPDVYNSRQKVPLLDLLIKESKKRSDLTDEGIQEEVDTFILSYDTTSTNMTFTLYLLAKHQEVQARMQAELDQIFGGQDRNITSDDVKKMKFLDACIKESLRLYCSIPLMSRTSGEAVRIQGHDIPAGTDIVMLTYLLHMDPATFPQPDEFRPQRFTQDNRGRNLDSFFFFSFLLLFILFLIY